MTVGAHLHQTGRIRPRHAVNTDGRDRQRRATCCRLGVRRGCTVADRIVRRLGRMGAVGRRSGLLAGLAALMWLLTTSQGSTAQPGARDRTFVTAPDGSVWVV